MARSAALRRSLSRIYRSDVADRLRVAAAPALEAWMRLQRACRRSRSSRPVLLVAETPMMLDHALEAWELIASDRTLRGHLTMPRRFADVAVRAAGEHHLVLHRWPWLTRLRWWALVVTANHISPYPRNVPTVRLQHGMDGVGKVLHGQGFTYGAARVLRHDGAPAYTRILESSEHVREHIVARLPQLAGSIVAVGNLTADRVLELDAERDALRSRMIGEGPVVAMLSTFGTHSLLETMGSDLLAEVVRLQRAHRYRFVMCTHPNLWSRQRKLAEPWDEQLLALEHHGIAVARPGADWRPYLAAADVAVSDHTSVCIPYALLGRPLITAQVPDGVLLDESTVQLLHRTTPTLTVPDELETALTHALAAGLSDESRVAASRAVSFPGEAAERIRQALLEVVA